MNEQAFQEAFEKLNKEQRQAAGLADGSRLDGPTLVIAGPGTGKTQLLSLRVANILRTRDVRPENILCLTYTEAGAEAMIKRLTTIIGRDAYSVQISTFHGFCQYVRTQYPEYFGKRATARMITEFQTDCWFDNALRNLPYDSLIGYVAPNGTGAAFNIGNAENFITDFYNSGLTPDELRRIIQQNLDFFDYVIASDFLDAYKASPSGRGKMEAKQLYQAELDRRIEDLVTQAPKELIDPVVPQTGVYEPYAYYLRRTLTEKCYVPTPSGDLGVTGNAYDAIFGQKSHAQAEDFVDRVVCQRLLEYLDIYEQYQQAKDEFQLYDYGDMIEETIMAIHDHPELKQKLQNRYHYILVDEFQDTNAAQMRVVDMLCEYADRHHPNILCVGDDDQAIMRFQGASVECIRQFREKYELEPIVLRENFRSIRGVTDLAKEIGAQIQERVMADKPIEPRRQEALSIERVAKHYGNPDLEYAAIAQDIRQRIDNGFWERCAQLNEGHDGREGTEIAVIARGHKELQALIPYLDAQGIAYNYKLETTIDSLASLQTLFECMRYVVLTAQGRYEEADALLPQILSAEEFGLPPETYLKFAFWAKRQYRRDEEGGGRKTWHEALLEYPDEEVQRVAKPLFAVAARALSEPATPLIVELAKPLIRYYRGHEDDLDQRQIIEFNLGVQALLRFIAAEQEAYTPGLLPVEAPSASLFSQPFTTLPKVVELMEAASRLRHKVDFSVSVGREHAITLTTAHSSKGLEWDLVYILDADQSKWGKGSGKGLFAGNMLFAASENKEVADLDDNTRLMFVAVTRARSFLQVGYATGALAGSLVDLFEVADQETTMDGLLAQTDVCWQGKWLEAARDNFALVTPQMRNMKLSPSVLNKFVTYDPKNLEATHRHDAFMKERVLQLPSSPNFSPTLGTFMHDFLQAELEHVLTPAAPGTFQLTEDRLLEATKKAIADSDFSEADIQHMQQRFDSFVEVFLPVWKSKVNTKMLCERSVPALLDEDIRLTGRCDLLCLDSRTMQIKVVDYKSGNRKTPDEVKENLNAEDYVRQLVFYKLLIENTTLAELQGYTVSEVTDVYIEPQLKNDYQLFKPVPFVPTDDEVEALKQLVRAVWWRLQRGDLDTSAFEESQLLANAKTNAPLVGKGVNKGKPRALKADELQSLYEQWLVLDWQERAGA
jgi:DNA helicase-2/ATP-dependent DNA helicase PcrA